MYQDYQGLCPDERKLLSQIFREIRAKDPVELQPPPDHPPTRTPLLSGEDGRFVSGKSHKAAP